MSLKMDQFKDKPNCMFVFVDKVNKDADGKDNDTDLTWNDATRKWEIASIALTAGEIKFRLNHDWGTNYGGSNGVLASGGDNIAIAEAGNYRVSLDLVNLTYTLTKL